MGNREKLRSIPLAPTTVILFLILVFLRHQQLRSRSLRPRLLSAERHPILRIYGSTIVWKDNRNGNSDIYMFDLSTSREMQITTNESKQEYPAISGNRIVWTDYRNRNEENWNTDIYMCTMPREDTGLDAEKQSDSIENKGIKSKSTPCFEIIFGIVSFLGVLQYKKR